MNQHVVVLGCAGFIGSNLTCELLKRGHHVLGVDDLSSGRLELLDDLKHKNFTFKRMSFFDLDPSDLDGRHVVYHLAAKPRVSYSVENPSETYAVNVTATLDLIHKVLDIKHDRRPKIVFASSSSVYGGAEVLPTPETTPFDPKSPYALHKATIEQYLSLYATLYDLQCVSLRFFNVFGRNQLGDSPYSTAIGAWLDAIIHGNPCRFDGTGDQSRDMCHVDNTVDGIIRAGETSKPLNGMAINIGTGSSITNTEVMQWFTSRFNSKFTVKRAPWRAGDVMHTQADITLAREVLGYEPKVDVYEGLGMTTDWYIKWVKRHQS